MAVRHSTPADNTFTPQGKVAWDAAHIGGTIYAADFTGYDATGATDSSAAISAAIASALANGITTVHINGTPIANSAIAISSGITLVGDGMFNTGITRNFSGASNTDGLFNITGAANVTIEKMTLRSAAGTTGGVIVSAIGNSSNAPSLVLRDVNLTTLGTNTHRQAVYLDGSAKNTGALGIRSALFENVQCFGGSQGAAFLKGVISFCWKGGGTFQAGGSSGKLEIDGDSTVTSQFIEIDCNSIDSLDLDFLDGANITTGNLGAITNTSNVSDVSVYAGQQSGAITASWLNSQVFTPAYGTWIPEVTATTVGDLSVTYSVQAGTWSKHGRTVRVTFKIFTSAFTHSTASGNLRITGLPFAAASAVANNEHIGPLAWQGITKANYTDINCIVDDSVSYIEFWCAGSAQNLAKLAVTDLPSTGAGGVNKYLNGTIVYETAN